MNTNPQPSSLGAVFLVYCEQCVLGSQEKPSTTRMAGDISRQNGKKGGRPKGEASILAERARIRLAQKITEELEPLMEAQIEQAKKGNTAAFKELLDRGFGKVKESVDLTTDGEKLVFVPSELITKHGLSAPPSTEQDSE